MSKDHPRVPASGPVPRGGHLTDPSDDGLKSLWEMVNMGIVMARALAKQPVRPTEIASVALSLKRLTDSVRATAELARQIEADRRRHAQRAVAIRAIDNYAARLRLATLSADGVMH